MEQLVIAVVTLALMAGAALGAIALAALGFLAVSALSLPASGLLLLAASAAGAVLFWRGSWWTVPVYFFVLGVVAGVLWYDLVPLLSFPVPAWAVRG